MTEKIGMVEKPIADTTDEKSELDPLLDTFDDEICDQCGEPADECVCDEDDDEDDDE